MEISSAHLVSLKENSRPTLSWLEDSIAANGGRGSSAYYSRLIHPFRGWSPAYPETSGYLIPTLLAYGKTLKDKAITAQALLCGEWLLSIQHREGWFPALYQNSSTPSLFNTAMILFGLKALFKETGEERYFQGLEKACRWAVKFAEQNDWTELHYRTKRSYYTRAVWALLVAGKELENQEGWHTCKAALNSFRREIQPDGWILHWEFDEHDFAFAHTMAYTWRGFLEAGQLLEDDDIIQAALQSFDIFLKKIGSEGVPGGAYRKGWEADHSFICLPGIFQLSVLSYKAFAYTQNPVYKKWGDHFWLTGNDQLPKNFWGRAGGIFGSKPAKGKYMPWKQPNWGAKFYLDALMEYVKNKKESC